MLSLDMASTGSDSPFNAWWLTQNHHSTSSQKPNEELYAAFKHSFPDVGPPSHPVAHSTDAPSHGIAAIGSIHPDPSLERYAFTKGRMIVASVFC